MAIQEGNLFPLFNYSTLKVYLQKSTQALIVYLNRPERGNLINQEMLFELETLFSWVPHHIEIQSILLTSVGPSFGQGIDDQELRKMDLDKIRKFLFRLQRLIYSLQHLPQTVVADLRQGAQGVSVELSIGADLRIGHHKARLQFDHLKNGMVPCCGGIGLLGTIIPKSYVKNWILSGVPIHATELMTSGFLHQTYQEDLGLEEGVHHRLLTEIKNQGSIQRIQSKRAFLESIKHEIGGAFDWEMKIGHAGLFSEDWKEALKAKMENREAVFTDPREFSRVIQAAHNQSLEEINPTPPTNDPTGPKEH